MPAGAPKGNENSSRKNRLWADTIRRACLANDGKLLRQIAEKIVALALEGDIQAMKEIGDRLDGKAKQQVELSGDPDNPVVVSERPTMTPEQWIDAHGLGPTARPTD